MGSNFWYVPGEYMKKYFFNFGTRSTSDIYYRTRDSAHKLLDAFFADIRLGSTHQGIALRFRTPYQPQTVWETAWDTSNMLYKRAWAHQLQIFENSWKNVKSPDSLNTFGTSLSCANSNVSRSGCFLLFFKCLFRLFVLLQFCVRSLLLIWPMETPEQ